MSKRKGFYSFLAPSKPPTQTIYPQPQTSTQRTIQSELRRAFPGITRRTELDESENFHLPGATLAQELFAVLYLGDADPKDFPSVVGLMPPGTPVPPVENPVINPTRKGPGRPGLLTKKLKEIENLYTDMMHHMSIVRDRPANNDIRQGQNFARSLVVYFWPSLSFYFSGAATKSIDAEASKCAWPENTPSVLSVLNIADFLGDTQYRNRHLRNPECAAALRQLIEERRTEKTTQEFVYELERMGNAIRKQLVRQKLG